MGIAEKYRPGSGNVRITVTELAREHIAFRALVRQAIPMLKAPHSFTQSAREQLALTLSAALKVTCEETTLPPPTDRDAPPETDDYEPGMCMEVPEP